MKKNKKEIVKRQAKTKEKARKKRQVRLAKPPPGFMERPPISQMEAPKGFMAISSSQALMEYAKPLMEKNAESLDELNQRMELASSLWNLAISQQKNEQQEYSRWMERAKASAKEVLNLDGVERDRYIAEMIERQVHLFPEEVQPAPPSIEEDDPLPGLDYLMQEIPDYSTLREAKTCPERFRFEIPSGYLRDF